MVLLKYESYIVTRPEYVIRDNADQELIDQIKILKEYKVRIEKMLSNNIKKPGDFVSVSIDEDFVWLGPTLMKIFVDCGWDIATYHTTTGGIIDCIVIKCPDTIIIDGGLYDISI